MFSNRGAVVYFGVTNNTLFLVFIFVFCFVFVDDVVQNKRKTLRGSFVILRWFLEGDTFSSGWCLCFASVWYLKLTGGIDGRWGHCEAAGVDVAGDCCHLVAVRRAGQGFHVDAARRSEFALRRRRPLRRRPGAARAAILRTTQRCWLRHGHVAIDLRRTIYCLLLLYIFIDLFCISWFIYLFLFFAEINIFFWECSYRKWFGRVAPAAVLHQRMLFRWISQGVEVADFAARPLIPVDGLDGHRHGGDQRASGIRLNQHSTHARINSAVAAVKIVHCVRGKKIDNQLDSHRAAMNRQLNSNVMWQEYCGCVYKMMRSWDLIFDARSQRWLFILRNMSRSVLRQ